MKIQNRDRGRWNAQLIVSAMACQDAQSWGSWMDIMVAMTNKRGVDGLPWLLQERLVAIQDYLVFSSKACTSLEDYLQSHILRPHALHISDWTSHYWEWWPAERFRTFCGIQEQVHHVNETM